MSVVPSGSVPTFRHGYNMFPQHQRNGQVTRLQLPMSPPWITVRHRSMPVMRMRCSSSEVNGLDTNLHHFHQFANFATLPAAKLNIFLK